MISDTITRDRGEGNGGGRCRDEPIESEPKPSDSEREEEDGEEEEMTDAKLEWMTQGPLALSVFLHKMLKQAKRMNIKFNTDSTMKA